MQPGGDANRHGRKDGKHRSLVKSGIRDGRLHPVDHTAQASMIGKNVQWLEIAVTDHGSLCAAWPMSSEPIDGGTKLVEAKLFG
jgi:hypothetical protein